jgi:predicted RNA binding protein YcfA (HicA-like mRNA interferase family)
VLAALERIGWQVKRQSGSHKLLAREDWPDYEFAFHDSDELGRRILAHVARLHGIAARRSVTL